MSGSQDRREVLKLSGLGLAAGVISSVGSVLSPEQAYAQAQPTSLLRTVLDRKKLIVGTGSTNAPWHFEDEKGQLVGMDIAMAHILSQGLFDDPGKIEANVTRPASAGESYSARVNRTSATPTIDWAIRASCIDAMTRPRVGTWRRARYERPSGAAGAV